MTRGLTEDQASLVGLADDVLAGRTANEQLAAVEASSTRVDDRLWSELAEAGLVGIAVPEEHGGAGLGLLEACLLLEAQGRRLAPVPLWETVVLGALPVARFGTEAQRARWLPPVADGSVRLSAAHDLGTGATTAVARQDGGGWRLEGRLELVPHGHVADALVVSAALPGGGTGLFLVPTEGLQRDAVPTTTHALAADVVLDGVEAEPLGEGSDAPAWAADRARVGLVALQLGVADEGVREAAAYLSAREQFGRPLATFQATTQALGDAYCDVQAVRATLGQAVWALGSADPGAAQARVAVDVAAWWAVDAGDRVQHAVQHLHGGIGADTTYPVHRRLLWSMRTGALLGGAGRQLARLGPAVLTVQG